mmetsp:Transcript_7449/g.11029  ORF Transcript_7449/g.11029 Transcript_7449/m.11029 type:complete len:164 (+) Transcript_7449:40-531(+)
MVHAFGYRARTRDLFAKDFRQHGPMTLTPYLIKYKLGDFVDIIGNGSIHRGMPYKYYHGRTGQIWNITPRAVGVEVNKRVKGRIMRKRLHVRIEHVRPSKCQADMKERELKNSKIQQENAKKDKKDWEPLIRKLPIKPKKGYVLKKKGQKIEHLAPTAFNFVC